MEIFEKYVNNFDKTNGMIKRKYHHSFRVASIAKIIAKEQDFNDNDIKLAYLCGLYHDIGRFKQAKNYHSFDDKIVDHGNLGYKVFLDRIASKEEITSKEEMLIAKVIMHHNKLKIPSNLSNKQKVFLSLTKDADMIDILYQIATIKDILIVDDSQISKGVEEAFMKHELVDYSLVKTNSDKNVLKLAFIFGLEYKESMQIVLDNKYIDKAKNILSDYKYSKYFKEINKYLKEENKNVR